MKRKTGRRSRECESCCLLLLQCVLSGSSFLSWLSFVGFEREIDKGSKRQRKNERKRRREKNTKRQTEKME